MRIAAFPSRVDEVRGVAGVTLLRLSGSTLDIQPRESFVMGKSAIPADAPCSAQSLVLRLTQAILLWFGLAVGLAATAEAAREQNRQDLAPAEPDGRPAIDIRDDSGGNVAEYALRLYEFQAARQQVRFVGRCDSACTLFLALPARETCITEGAYFRFHAPSGPSASAAVLVEGYMLHKYPQWVRAWIVAQGGLTDALSTMTYDYANKFMRTCR